MGKVVLDYSKVFFSFWWENLAGWKNINYDNFEILLSETAESRWENDDDVDDVESLKNQTSSFPQIETRSGWKIHPVLNKTQIW